ncbi:mutator MutT protein [[Clostridium] sordellii]|uniref:NUDIX hydrolase N-terminal domain-containing protein n=1 Tax=Paraclostridium sordellii TaxID=1505 RepID=UPI0005EA2CE0|nr:NUDIX hydrolase [Paeniclostridium sordellii]MBX9180681.1 NUDIX hydrolase [Paeniclostridium sordellii]CEO09059.1 mutator MutT protein [[Clostridium] sordellii] [Paeniclostridium sordellii]
MEQKWLKWATEIQSISQAGLTYSKDKYDLERFNKLKDISSEIISEYTNIEIEKVREIINIEEGYLTPKVDIRGAIIKGNEILMVKESIDGSWSLPGGWADVNLSVSENIIKEAREEAGVDIKPTKIVSILDKNKYNKPISVQSIYKVFILCDFISGKFEKNIETEESKFFKFDELPNLSTARNTKEQIKMCFDAFNKEGFETIFD